MHCQWVLTIFAVTYRRAVRFSQDFFLQEFSCKATPEKSCQVLPKILSLARLSVGLTTNLARIKEKSCVPCANRMASNFLPKLVHMLLFSAGKKLNFHFLNSPIFGYCRLRSTRDEKEAARQREFATRKSAKYNVLSNGSEPFLGLWEHTIYCERWAITDEQKGESIRKQ